MRTSRFNILHLGAIALAALVLLQIIWNGWLQPLSGTHRWMLPALTILPLLPGLWICRRNLRRGVLVGGIVCLFYFCHGVALAWSDHAARLPALIEIMLSLSVIGALGWDARHYKRKPK
jgi:uncharacterized membrane protein